MFKRSGAIAEPADKGNGWGARRPNPLGRRQEPTPVGASFRIRGAITGSEDLVVYGHVEGSIDLDGGLVVVTQGGQVEADVRARVITVEGRVKGDLHASEQIIVRRTGRVDGSIAAPRIALDFGCAFSGAIDTDVAAAPTTDEDKIADFKAAISGTAQSNAAGGPFSPR